MGTILKDTKSRVSTLCKCRELSPVSMDVKKCMEACEFYEEGRGDWCLHYRRATDFCTHMEPQD